MTVFATAIVYQLYYPNRIVISKSISTEVYINGESWTNDTTIDWGTIDITPINLTKTIAVKNTGSIYIVLKFEANITQPNFFELSWDYIGQKIAPNDWWNGTLTLSVLQFADNGDYTFDSWITATETIETTSSYYSGPLKINLPAYNSYDDSVYSTASVAVKIYHADKCTLFGSTTTSTAITGTLLPEDNGILYMVLDLGVDTEEYIDSARITNANSYITEHFPWDYDSDGIIEYGYTLNLTSLTPLAEGESYKEITINQYYWRCDVTGLMDVSLINATSADLSGTSYVDLTSSGYISGCSLGYGFKIVKVELLFPNSANASYYDNGQVKNIWISLGYGKDKTWTWSSFQARGTGDLYLTANIGVIDITQEYYGRLMFYESGAATTVFTYNVHIQGANFSPGAVWMPTLEITYINPAGTLGTISGVMSFTDT